jgi:hypothetical protein
MLLKTFYAWFKTTNKLEDIDPDYGGREGFRVGFSPSLNVLI